MTEKVLDASALNPEKIVDALELCSKGFKPVAGGTDLVVRYHALKNNGRATPPIFCTKRLEGTRDIILSGGILEIGAGVTLSEIINFPDTPELLRESLQSIASPGIRNSATLTGNICNASPAADSLPALYVLDAVVHLALSQDNPAGYGIKEIPVSEFITGPGRTADNAAGIVTSVSFRIPDDCRYIFRKIGTRAANALSKLSAAALWKTEGRKFTDFRLAAGACAPTVVRSAGAESIVNGKNAAELSGMMTGILEKWAPLLNPIDDQRSTARYRKNTALRLIESIIMEAAE